MSVIGLGTFITIGGGFGSNYFLKQRVFHDVELQSTFVFSVTFSLSILLFFMFLFEITELGTDWYACLLQAKRHFMECWTLRHEYNDHFHITIVLYEGKDEKQVRHYFVYWDFVSRFDIGFAQPPHALLINWENLEVQSKLYSLTLVFKQIC